MVEEYVGQLGLPTLTRIASLRDPPDLRFRLGSPRSHSDKVDSGLGKQPYLGGNSKLRVKSQ